MTNENWKVELQKNGCEVTPSGSRVSCVPEPLDSDFDFLVVIPDNSEFVSRFMTLATSLGFTWEGSEHYQNAADTFMSWRSDSNVNLIVTRNVEFAKRHHAATDLCGSLNIMNKAYRVRIFQAILYGDMKSTDAETMKRLKDEVSDLRGAIDLYRNKLKEIHSISGDRS